MLVADRNAQTDFSHPTKGGGVALYIRESIAFLRHELSDGVEHISVILKVRGGNVGLVIAYRPQHVNYTCLSSLFQASFIEFAAEVKTVAYSILFYSYLGHNNIDLLSKSCNKASHLRNLLKSYNSVQHISEPTRETACSFGNS